MKIHHSRFEENIGVAILIYGDNMYKSEVSIVHSEFINNTVKDSQTRVALGLFQSSSLVTLDPVMTTVSLNEFINNRFQFSTNKHPIFYYS